MQRVLNAYAKYFNTKYQRVGHVFEGPFRAVFIESNEQFLYLSAYLHCNPRELPNWKNKAYNYPRSTYQDYIGKNRWGEFVERSGAKDRMIFKTGTDFL